jgi:hypothetical protein
MHSGISKKREEKRKKANPRNSWRKESRWDCLLSTKNQALAVHVRGGSKRKLSAFYYWIVITSHHLPDEAK